MTPYAAAKIVNEVLRANDLPEIRPQMMYNYTTGRLNKGKTPLIECDRNGVTRDGLEKWIQTYVTKKLNPTATENVFTKTYA